MQKTMKDLLMQTLHAERLRIRDRAWKAQWKEETDRLEEFRKELKQMDFLIAQADAAFFPEELKEDRDDS